MHTGPAAGRWAVPDRDGRGCVELVSVGGGQSGAECAVVGRVHGSLSRVGVCIVEGAEGEVELAVVEGGEEGCCCGGDGPVGRGGEGEIYQY